MGHPSLYTCTHLTHGHGHAPPLRARRASRPTRRLRADTDDASVEQLALMREEVDRPNLVSDWPATPHPRSTVHEASSTARRSTGMSRGLAKLGGAALRPPPLLDQLVTGRAAMARSTPAPSSSAPG